MTYRFPDEVSSLIQSLQAAYCDDYYKDPENNWNKQILVINFIIASTVENYSQKRGATKINIDENTLNQYFENVIVPELDIEKASKYPILTSQCIKFLIIYRHMIPQAWLVDIVTKMSSFLTHESIVIRTYSACAIEKLLSMRDLTTKNLIFTKEVLSPLLLDLLKQLNTLITESEGLEIYALMSLFRIISIAQEEFMPFASNFAEAVGTFVDKTIKDTNTTAYSIYILFETIGYIIHWVAQTDSKTVKEYEDALLPKLNNIIEKNRTDVIIYVFQIYAAFVLNSASSELGNTYAVIAKSVLEDPSNTDADMKYLVPGEIRLLCAILYKYPDFFAPYKEHLFGLMDKVLTTLSLEEDAVNLLACISEVFPVDSISDELVSATKSVFQRMFLYKDKTRLKRIPDVFLKSVYIFMARFILSNGVEAFVGLTNSIQNGILLNFFEKEGLCIGRIGRNEFYRRHVLTAFTTLVTEYQELRGHAAMVTLVQGLIENICPTGKFETGIAKDDANEDLPVEYQEDTATFERTNFQPLYSINISRSEKLPDVQNWTLYVLQCIEQVVKMEHSNFLQQVGAKLTKDTQEYFGELCNTHNINIF